MKVIITFFVALFLVSSAFFRKDNSGVTKFKTTYFNNNGATSKNESNFFPSESKLDFDFYEKNFYMSIIHPESFINKKYKNQTINIGKDSILTEADSLKPIYIYKYDNLSRVIEYGYSGCPICDITPYYISIKYDKKNRPVIIENKYHLFPWQIRQIEEEKREEEKREQEIKLMKKQKNGNIILTNVFSTMYCTSTPEYRPSRRYFFVYDNADNIVQVIIYDNNKLARKIEKLEPTV